MNDNYLYDIEFLKKIDEYPNKIVYIKIFLLDLSENIIDQIEGKVINGSLNIDGTSSVQRSCSFSLYVKEQKELNEYYWGLKTKIKIEIGISNFIDLKYPEILWFKQGIFVLTSFSSSCSASGMSISISAKDKMCLLNGELSGTINASVDFGTLEEIQGNIELKKIKIKTILPYLLHSFGGELYSNIIINDVEDTGLNLVEYDGIEGDIYLLQETQNSNQWDVIAKGTSVTWNNETAKVEVIYNNPNFLPCRMVDITNQNKSGFSTIFYQAENRDEKEYYIHCVKPGEAIGYCYTDLVFPGELTCKPGDTVVSVLDKIKEMLGTDYEYFYNTNGQFIFQKGQQYIQTDWQPLTFYVDGMTIVGKNSSSPVSYNFNNLGLITSLSNAPNISEVKNDFTCWCQDKNNNPIHMRIAIDKKPYAYKTISVSQEEIKEWNSNHLDETIDPKLAQVSTLYDTRQIDSDYSLTANIEEGELIKFSYDVTNDDYTHSFTSSITIYEAHGNNYNTNYDKIVDILKTRNCILLKEQEEYYIIVERPVAFKGMSYGAGGAEKKPTVPFAIKEKQEPKTILKLNEEYIETDKIIDVIIDKYTYSKIKLDLTPLSKDYLDTTYFQDGKTIETDSWEIEFNPSTYSQKNLLLNIYQDSWSSSRCPLLNYYSSSKEKGSEFIEKIYQSSFTGGDGKKAWVQIIFPVPSILFGTFFVVPGSFYFSVNKIKFNYTEYKNPKTNFLDWRELIYQMAKDNYNFGRFDNFKNKLVEANRELNLYQNGITGYEQYYVDILSFWRDLYKYEETKLQAITRQEAVFEFNQNNIVYYTGYNKIEPLDIGLYNLDNIIIKDIETNKWYDFISYVNPIAQASYANDRAYVYIFNASKEYTQVPHSIYNFNYKKENFKRLYATNLQSSNPAPGTSFFDLSLSWCQKEVNKGNIEIWADTKDLTQITKETPIPAVGVYEINYYLDLDGYHRDKDEDNLFEESQGGTSFTKNIPVNNFYSKSKWDYDLLSNPSGIKYWLDFIDTQGDIAAYSNKIIGNRQKVINNNNAKSLWYLDVPNIIYGESNVLTSGKYCFLNNIDKTNLTISTQGLNAKQLIETDLNNYAYLKNNISITCIPIYYLQPNTVFTLYDKDTKTYKRYLINRISYNLAYNGLMTISASEIIERIY